MRLNSSTQWFVKAKLQNFYYSLNTIQITVNGMFSKDNLYVNQIHSCLLSISCIPKVRVSILREIQMGSLSLIYERLVFQMFIMLSDYNLEYISIYNQCYAYSH